MATFLFRVGDRFAAKGHGTVLVSDRPWSKLDPSIRLRIGDAIEIRSTDREPLKTSIIDVPHLATTLSIKPIALRLPLGVSKDEISVGAEVWQLT